MNPNTDKVVVVSARSVWNAVWILLLVAGLYYIRDIVYVFLTSIVLASFVEFGVKKLVRRRIGRSLSVVLIYFCTLGLFGAFLYFFVPVFIGQMAQFSLLIHEYLPASASSATEGLAGLPFSDMLGKFGAFASDTGMGAVQAATLIFGGMFNIVILIVVSFYLSMEKNGVEKFLRVIIPDKNEEYVVGLWKRTEHKIGLWFQGQLLLGLLVSVLTYLGLLLFNVKYSLLLALAAGILELIPFGIILAAVPAIASGYISGGLTTALKVTGLYVIIQQFEANLIQPLIIKKVVGISSLVVILSLLVGMKLAGFWGVILSIPVAVCIMEFVDDLDKRKKSASV
jgi:predicted PurR-regulated permease PerM